MAFSSSFCHSHFSPKPRNARFSEISDHATLNEDVNQALFYYLVEVTKSPQNKSEGFLLETPQKIPMMTTSFLRFKYSWYQYGEVRGWSEVYQRLTFVTVKGGRSFGLRPDWKHCSGDTDPLLPLTSTRYSINALNLTVTRTWYAWYHNGTVGGWSEVYNGLTFLTVKGAGHMFPLYRPQQSLLMFKNFLRNQQMPGQHIFLLTLTSVLLEHGTISDGFPCCALLPRY